jgi:ATP-dependent Clp protease protease subunit
MSEASKVLGALGVWVAGCMLILVLGAQTAGIVWLASVAESYRHPDELVDDLVDAQIEAGFGEAGLDPADPLLARRQIVITYTITERTAKDVVNRLFHLDALDDTAPIDLYISTQGGWPDAAFTVVDAIRMIDAPVNTWAMGGCYSAGALILAAGTGRRYSTDSAIVMVHTNVADSAEPFSYGRLERFRYEAFWREAAELPADWFPMTGEAVYYLSPDEALQFGVIDEVLTGPLYGVVTE